MIESIAASLAVAVIATNLILLLWTRYGVHEPMKVPPAPKRWPHQVSWNPVRLPQTDYEWVWWRPGS